MMAVKINSENIKDMSLDDVIRGLGTLAAGVHFGKSLEEIQATPEYKLLEQREKELIAAMPDDGRNAVMQTNAGQWQQNRDMAVSSEKQGRIVAKITAVTAAAGAGVVVHALYDYFFHGADAEAISKSPEAAAKAAKATVAPSIEQEPASGTWVSGEQVHESQLGEAATSPETVVAEKVSAEPVATENAPKISTIEHAEAITNSAKSVDVGSRGIEGTMIDMVKQEPNGATAKWLAKEYPGMDFKSAIHKRVMDLAKSMDAADPSSASYSVDGAGKDLSDITSAKIKINADGSFGLDKVEFAENRPKIGMPEPKDTAQARFGPENIETENMDFEQLKPIEPTKDFSGVVTPESMPDASPIPSEVEFDKAYHALDGEKKASDALKKLLHKDYKPFMKDIVNLDARDLNKIQEMRVTDFLILRDHEETPPSLRNAYKGLSDKIEEYLKTKGPDKISAFKGESVRKLLIRLASERMVK
jgi:hypothetical protein